MKHTVPAVVPLLLLASLSASLLAQPAQQPTTAPSDTFRFMLSQERVIGFAEHTRGMLGLFDTGGLVVERDRFVAPGSRRDPLPALTDPSRTPASEAPFPSAKDAVVMVDIDGESVAYPMSVLTYHCVVNDTVGGVPIAVWYDPISNGLAVFRRDPESIKPVRGDEAREFRVAGLLLHGSAVLYDPASRALFSPLEGRGLSGAFAGARLVFVPFRVLTLGEFRDLRPEGETLSKPAGTPFDYAVNPFAPYQDDPAVLYMQTTTDARAHPKAPGVGIADDDGAYFVPLNALLDGERSYMTTAGPVRVALTPDNTLHIRECPEGATALQSYFANWASAHPATRLVVALDLRESTPEAPAVPGR